MQLTTMNVLNYIWQGKKKKHYSRRDENSNIGAKNNGL